jgi:hypothetical protein
MAWIANSTLISPFNFAVRIPGHRLCLLTPFGKAHFQQASGELSLHRDGGDRRHGAERVDNDTDIALADRGGANRANSSWCGFDKKACLRRLARTEQTNQGRRPPK